MLSRQAVFPAQRQDLYTKSKYSAAIQSRNLLFVSGPGGSRADGSPEPDFEGHVALAFKDPTAVLKGAGCTLDDEVDITTFHTDPEAQFEPFLTGI